MRKCPCRFLIPLALNDGTPIDVATFMDIKRRIELEFGAYRVITESSEGCWEGQCEGVMEIEVAVVPKRVPELRKLVLRFGSELGQEAVYFAVPPPSVEILDVKTGEMIEEDDCGHDEVDHDD